MPAAPPPNMRSSDQSREIPKRVQCPKLTTEQVRKITDLCFALDTVKNPQAILVFGTSTQHEELADAVLNVMDEHGSATLILTGGRPNFSETLGDKNPATAESEILLEKMAQRTDLSRYRIVLETESRNTLENVQFVEHTISSLGARSITFLAQSFAVGRSAMTIRAVLPTVTVGGAAGVNLLVEGKRLRADTWFGHGTMRDIVWGEFLRIVAYSKRGDIDPAEQRVSIADLAQQLGLES